MSFVEGIKSDLNRIRKDPKSFEKLFKNMRNTLERFKGKNHPLVKETEQFMVYLTKAPTLSELNVSTALIKAAEKRLDQIEVLGKYEPVSDSALNELASRYGKGHSAVYELVDDGAQEPEEVLSRLVMNENDKDRYNRKVIFDPKVMFFGVGHRLVDEKHLTVIFFAEKITDLPEKSMAVELFERINRIRAKPSSYINDFQIMSKIFKRVKKSSYLADDCDSLIDSLAKEKPKPELKQSEQLTNLAKVYTEQILKKKQSNIIEVNDLVQMSKVHVSGYKYITGAGAYNLIDPDRVLEKLIINEFDTQKVIRQTILNETTRYMGIHSEKIGYIPITIIVLSDNAQTPDLRSLEDKVADEFNKIRKNPASLIESLTKYRSTIEKSSKKKNQLDYINELLDQLKNAKPLPEFLNSKALSMASDEFFKLNMRPTSVFENRVYREENEFLVTRLSHYCNGYKEVYQFVESGSDNLADIIFNLIIEPRDETHEFRKAILDEKIRFFGVAKCEFKGKPLTSIILADNIEVLKERQFVDNLLEEMNHLRKNPKSYVKLYEKLSESQPNKKTVILKMNSFLKSSRFYGPFQRSDLLTKAAEARLQFIKEENEVKAHSQEDIKVFLSDYCSGYLNVAEIISQGFNAPQDLLINTMINDDFESGSRSYIFNQKLYYVGLAYEAKNNILVALFADTVEEKKDENIYVHTHWRKIRRPDLTEDEEKQIIRDFNKLDVMNKGTIMPQHVFVFISKLPDFESSNPVYYNAIKNNVNNIHFQQAGMTVKDFLEECKKIIFMFDNDDWQTIYCGIIGDQKKKGIDYEIFRNMTKSLGYKISDQECQEILKKLSDERSVVDFNKFIEIMNLMESKK